ncbi:MAG: DUF354 domain-containing protein [Bacteroidales bacterium]|nr:DUF354 domain-containing protein [Bacteroidales bacterium]
MKILIDINHPQHVHCFRFFIYIMKSKGHEVLVISRNKEIEHSLLKTFKIPFVDRGKGSSSMTGKFFYFFKAISIIYKQCKIFKPDILLSFGTPYPAIAGWLLRIPHISFNDTEDAKLHHLLTDTFSKHIVTPACYKDDLGKKHIRIKSYFELYYLHPHYYKANDSIVNLLNLKDNEKYIILRFVSWKAVHDVGHKGLTLEMKRKLVNKFSKNARVFITSETKLSPDLEQFRMNIPAGSMHDALCFASLLFGESATMASESAMLGTPSVYLDKNGRGYTDELQEKYNLVWNFSTTEEQQNKALEKGIEIILDATSKSSAQDKSKLIKNENIDITAFTVWFIENYPQSVQILKEDPDYQYQFK